MPSVTQPILIQGDREIYPEDLEHIRIILEKFPGLSRTEAIYTLCETLNWLTPAGLPKFAACKKLLHRLETQGSIRLPARRKQYYPPGAASGNPAQRSGRTDAQPMLRTSIQALGAIQLIPVDDKAQQALWNEYVGRYHYLGYKRPFGYRQRYFIEAGGRCLGCVLLSGPAKALKTRDRWIGWNERQRRKNLPWVLNNNRFVVFPWVQVANLASHVLGQLARRVADDWQQRWGYRPVLLETFVDPARFRGSCYRAAGWQWLGRTSGQGLIRPGSRYRTSPKLILAKPLQADFRRLLCSDQLQGRTEL